MGPVLTSPRALHGWVLEASSCSFKSRRAGTSIVWVLSWAKPYSASWDLCVVCTFLKKKVLPFGCSPRASCCLAQGALRVFYWNLSDSSSKGSRAYTHFLCWEEFGFSYVRVLFVEKSSDIAMSRFFLSCGLEVVCPEEVFRVTCAFFWKKCTHWV